METVTNGSAKRVFWFGECGEQGSKIEKHSKDEKQQEHQIPGSSLFL